jgi:hypothetical protein
MVLAFSKEEIDKKKDFQEKIKIGICPICNNSFFKGNSGFFYFFLNKRICVR